MLTIDQVMGYHKANFETAFGLSATALTGVEKVAELNMAASKAVLSEAADYTQALLSVKDAQEFVALQSSLLQPVAEKMTAYNRQLYEIMTATGTEFSKAVEEQIAQSQKTALGLVDNMAKNAPAGSETAVAVLKSTISAANNAFEAVQKVVKQATDVAEANYATVAATATAGTKSTSKK